MCRVVSPKPVVSFPCVGVKPSRLARWIVLALSLRLLSVRHFAEDEARGRHLTIARQWFTNGFGRAIFKRSRNVGVANPATD